MDVIRSFFSSVEEAGRAKNPTEKGKILNNALESLQNSHVLLSKEEKAQIAQVLMKAIPQVANTEKRSKILQLAEKILVTPKSQAPSPQLVDTKKSTRSGSATKSELLLKDTEAATDRETPPSSSKADTEKITRLVQAAENE